MATHNNNGLLPMINQPNSSLTENSVTQNGAPYKTGLERTGDWLQEMRRKWNSPYYNKHLMDEANVNEAVNIKRASDEGWGNYYDGLNIVEQRRVGDALLQNPSALDRSGPTRDSTEDRRGQATVNVGTPTREDMDPNNELPEGFFPPKPEPEPGPNVSSVDPSVLSSEYDHYATPEQLQQNARGLLSSFNQNREEDSPLKGRGKGVLGQLGKIVGGMFNTEDPNFRDNLVIGLGNLAGTTPNENGLTRQAMENIQARKEIALNDADNNRLMEIAKAQALEPSDSYLKDQREWLTNGVANSRASMANLGRAAEIISNNPDSVTASTAIFRSIPVIGKLLESLEGKRWADSATAQQLVEQVLAQNLRDILGGQFAALEGYKYLERGYNNVLGQEENLLRINLLMSTIQQATDAKNAMYANGTYTDEAFAERVRQIDASMYRTNSETGDISDLEGNIISSVNWGSDNFAYKGYLESSGVTEDDWNGYSLDIKRSAIDGISRKNAADAYARTQYN